MSKNKIRLKKFKNLIRWDNELNKLPKEEFFDFLTGKDDYDLLSFMGSPLSIKFVKIDSNYGGACYAILDIGGLLYRINYYNAEDDGYVMFSDLYLVEGKESITYLPV